jgi:hypothetical protein
MRSVLRASDENDRTIGIRWRRSSHSAPWPRYRTTWARPIVPAAGKPKGDAAQPVPARVGLTESAQAFVGRDDDAIWLNRLNGPSAEDDARREGKLQPIFLILRGRDANQGERFPSLRGGVAYAHARRERGLSTASPSIII